MSNETSKTELHAELLRADARIKFLQSANCGTALPADVIAELQALIKKREFILSELKN